MRRGHTYSFLASWRGEPMGRFPRSGLTFAHHPARISQIGKLNLTIANEFDLSYLGNRVLAARRAVCDGAPG